MQQFAVPQLYLALKCVTVPWPLIFGFDVVCVRVLACNSYEWLRVTLFSIKTKHESPGLLELNAAQVRAQALWRLAWLLGEPRLQLSLQALGQALVSCWPPFLGPRSGWQPDPGSLPRPDLSAESELPVKQPGAHGLPFWGR